MQRSNCHCYILFLSDFSIFDGIKFGLHFASFCLSILSPKSTSRALAALSTSYLLVSLLNARSAASAFLVLSACYNSIFRFSRSSLHSFFLILSASFRSQISSSLISFACFFISVKALVITYMASVNSVLSPNNFAVL